MKNRCRIQSIVACFLAALACVFLLDHRGCAQDRFAFEPIDPRPVELSDTLSLKEPLVVELGETKIPGPIELRPDSHYKFSVDYNWGDYRERRFPVFGIDSDLFRFDPAHLGVKEDQWRTISFYFRTPREKTVSNVQFFGEKLFSAYAKPERYRNWPR